MSTFCFDFVVNSDGIKKASLWLGNVLTTECAVQRVIMTISCIEPSEQRRLH